MLLRYLRYYGFSGLLNFAISFVKTKLFFPGAKIVRFPIDVRGKKKIQFSSGFTTGRYCRLETLPFYSHEERNEICLSFGINVQINDFCHITAMNRVVIGNNVLIASKVYISDVSHGSYSNEIHSAPNIVPNSRELVSNPVNICDNVWVGDGVCVLPGVTIGVGSIIGANSVVTKDVPANVIAVGIPAVPIKYYNFEIKKWVKI